MRIIPKPLKKLCKTASNSLSSYLDRVNDQINSEKELKDVLFQVESSLSKIEILNEIKDVALEIKNAQSFSDEDKKAIESAVGKAAFESLQKKCEFLK